MVLRVTLACDGFKVEIKIVTQSDIDESSLLDDAPSASWLVMLMITKHGRVLAGLVLSCVMLLQIVSNGFEATRLQNTIFDVYQRLAPRIMDRFPVVIVDVDEETLIRFGQWPWPRTLLARLIKKTDELEPLSIGLDIILTEPDRRSPSQFVLDNPGLAPNVKASLARMPSNDAIFAKTISELYVAVGRAALPEIPPHGKFPKVRYTPIQLDGPSPASKLDSFDYQLVNVPEISAASFGHGYLNGLPDADGIARRMPMVISVGENLAPAMGLELIRIALGENWITVVGDDDGFVEARVGDASLKANSNGKVVLHFTASDPRRRVSAAKVLADELEPGALANSIVLIGVTGLGLTDVSGIPLAPRMDGVEIQAQFIENMLSQSGLDRPKFAEPGELGAVFLAGILLIAFLPKLGPLAGALPYLAMAAGFIGLGFGAFVEFKMLLDPFFPVLAVSLVFGSLFLSRLMETDRNKKISDANLRRQRVENARMAGELRAARDIQMGILPDIPSIKDIPENIDAYAFLEPANVNRGVKRGQIAV
jgi:adenylate cyclase